MRDLPVGLPSEIVPLSWLLGVWEGSGVLEYQIGEESVSRTFGHRLSFSHDGLPYLNYNSYTWLEPESGAEGDEKTPLATETGYWRLSRPQTNGDPGPGLLPGDGDRPFTTTDAVETLRNAAGGFDIEVVLAHPSGLAELYLGQVKGPRIDLATDAVVRTAGAKPYAAATRLYGLVDNHLLWAWDIAALGQTLRTHASGRLARAE
ncbi:fatty acid-binding protein [Cryobacterium sp. MLB-32]|uniref:FABP family protein n=1 Tax=Cryobacterium sp. MLB-32 TaxID=1529318 RepID=UPI0004E73B01|nr:FABP family protein [Cryobacterium sp. MLB-32]KFF60054.1 fatty acid-binding protein [Cryobacterium sp. MLB-32]